MDGSFHNSYVIASDRETKLFVGRFIGGFSNRCLGAQGAMSPGYYYHPGRLGKNLQEQAALLGCPATEPKEISGEPEEMTQLAALINKDPGSSEIGNNPTLKRIFAQLARRNQNLFAVSEAIFSRCQAARGMVTDRFQETPGDPDGTGAG